MSASHWPVEDIARALLGEPNRALSTRRQLRYGSHGSLAVELDGDKRGSWYDHQEGVGGPLLSLVERRVGSNGAAADFLRPFGIKIGGGQQQAPKQRIVTTYPYHDEAGKLLFQVVRLESKKFYQRRPNGRGGWIDSVKGTRQVPYRLPEMLARPEGAPVYVVEGEKDADRLAGLGLCATTNPGGASNGKSKWRAELNPHFAGADVVVLPDNDEAGRNHAQTVAASLQPVAASVRVVELPGLPPKGDVSDWLDAGGAVDRLQALANQAPLWAPGSADGDGSVAQLQGLAEGAPLWGASEAPQEHAQPWKVSAADLLTMTFPPLRYVVEGYVVEGLTVLGGRPKLGKSWLALDFAVAVATGGRALGSIRCERSDVLYLALEDNLRRLQARLQETLAATYGHQVPDVSRLELRTAAERLDAGLIETLEAWRAEVPDARLVIIDVFAKVRPQRGKGEGVYEYDYRCAEPLQQWAIKHGVAVVVIHHVRKADAEDPLEMLSGSNGLTGAADTILVLARDAQGLTLYGRGRDIEEIETAVDRDAGAWRIRGDAAEVRKSDERRVVLKVLREASEPMGPRDIAALAGMKEVNARNLLVKMVKDGEIKREGRGLYAYPGYTGYTGYNFEERL